MESCDSDSGSCSDEDDFTFKFNKHTMVKIIDDLNELGNKSSKRFSKDIIQLFSTSNYSKLLKRLFLFIHPSTIILLLRLPIWRNLRKKERFSKTHIALPHCVYLLVPPLYPESGFMRCKRTIIV